MSPDAPRPAARRPIPRRRSAHSRQAETRSCRRTCPPRPGCHTTGRPAQRQACRTAGRTSPPQATARRTPRSCPHAPPSVPYRRRTCRDRSEDWIARRNSHPTRSVTDRPCDARTGAKDAVRHHSDPVEGGLHRCARAFRTQVCRAPRPMFLAEPAVSPAGSVRGTELAGDRTLPALSLGLKSASSSIAARLFAARWTAVLLGPFEGEAALGREGVVELW